jgi:hypothetical protein
LVLGLCLGKSHHIERVLFSNVLRLDFAIISPCLLEWRQEKKGFYIYRGAGNDSCSKKYSIITSDSIVFSSQIF